jgi:hypothetical protein
MVQSLLLSNRACLRNSPRPVAIIVLYKLEPSIQGVQAGQPLRSVIRSAEALENSLRYSFTLALTACLFNGVEANQGQLVRQSINAYE